VSQINFCERSSLQRIGQLTRGHRPLNHCSTDARTVQHTPSAALTFASWECHAVQMGLSPRGWEAYVTAWF